MAGQKQIEFNFRTHGGARRGAGRKKRLIHESSHAARPEVDEKSPCHVVIKLLPCRPRLRTPKFIRAFTRAIKRMQVFGVGVQHFAIESNHIHLILEAPSGEALARAMASLLASITWAMRRIFRFYGPLFLGRYHLHKVVSPREMRNVLRYVLFNHSKHCGMKPFADVFSSIFSFENLRDLLLVRLPDPPDWQREITGSIRAARSWLQRVGWRRQGEHRR